MNVKQVRSGRVHTANFGMPIPRPSAMPTALEHERAHCTIEMYCPSERCQIMWIGSNNDESTTNLYTSTLAKGRPEFHKRCCD